jgi:hypothetical protein
VTLTRRGRIISGLSIIVLVLAAPVIAGAVYLRSIGFLGSSDPGKKVEVIIKKGATVNEIADELERAFAALLAAEPGVLWSHLGRYVIFEGRVLSVGNRRQRSYLDFGTDWSRDTTVEIEAADRERFGGAEALAELAGQVIRVRGFVEDSRGPMVRARWPGQIERVAPGASGGSGKAITAELARVFPALAGMP